MGHTLDARPGAGFVATLTVEGRPAAARPLRGSWLGSASGLCVHVDSPAALRTAATSLPGRILVLGGGALAGGILAGLPVGAGFAAVVVLTGDRAALERIGVPMVRVPCVAVGLAVDQEHVRRAFRVTVTVQDGPGASAAVPAPRHPHHRRHPSIVVPSTSTPGTIDLRR